MKKNSKTYCKSLKMLIILSNVLLILIEMLSFFFPPHDSKWDSHLLPHMTFSGQALVSSSLQNNSLVWHLIYWHNVVNVCGPASPFTLDFFFHPSTFLLSSFLSEVFQALFSPQVTVISNSLEGTIIQTCRWCTKERRRFLLSLSFLQFLQGQPVVNETAGCFDPTLSCPHGTLLTIVWLYATLLKANSGFLLRNVQKYLRSPSVVKGRLRGPNELMCEIAISIW